MKQDIDKNNNEPQERQEYVAPSVKVIEVATQRVLCASGSNEDYTNNTPDWFGSL